MVLTKKFTISSPAKINLYLKFFKKRNNNLHEIESLVSHISLFDKIEISNSKKTRVNFFGKFSNLISSHDNSVIKILNILKKKNKKIKNKNFLIKVFKNIPVGAGLGGGTSNAVSILFFLIKKFKLKLGKKVMNDLLNQIGTDSYNFINPYSKILYGTGTKFKLFKSKINLNLLLIFPNIPNYTKEIYVLNNNFSVKNRSNIYIKNFCKDKFKFLKTNQNDLLEAAQKNNPRIKNLMIFIKKKQFSNLIQMSGSGSCCYVVFKNKKNLLKCQKFVKKQYKSYWTAVVKTIK